MLKARGLRLVAEKVETDEEAERCRELGFDAFQGYFFARPAPIHGRPLPSTQINTLCRLLETGAEVDIDELESIIEVDLGLSQRLLRLSNSAAISPATRVRSLRHALTLLGTRTIRRNATILSLAGIADAPHVVLGTALVRARAVRLRKRRGLDPGQQWSSFGSRRDLTKILGARSGVEVRFSFLYCAKSRKSPKTWIASRAGVGFRRVAQFRQGNAFDDAAQNGLASHRSRAHALPDIDSA